MGRRALGSADFVARYAGQRQITFLVPLGWHCDAWMAERMAAAIASQRQRFPSHQFIVLGNTPEETRLLQEAGVEAFFVNRTSTSLKTFSGRLPDAVVEFDAIYNARPVRP